MINQNRHIGLFMIILGAAFWGISSTMMQWLINHNHVEVAGLVSLRLIPAGLIILFILLAAKKDIWSIWKNKSSCIQIVLYGIIGILGLQYTFMNAIQSSSAVTATLFQFLGSIFITFHIALRVRRLPSYVDWTSMTTAFVGIFLVVTGGTVQMLSFTTEGVLWGMLTALTFAFYTVYPMNLLQKWGPALISGWGMLIGGVFFVIFDTVFYNNVRAWGALNWFSLSLVGFIILFGTGLAFFLYAVSLQHLKPMETSILAMVVEPLAAIILSVLWLSQSFGWLQGIGAILVVGSAVLLSIRPVRNSKASYSAITKPTPMSEK